jgi:hypothetical protein
MAELMADFDQIRAALDGAPLTEPRPDSPALTQLGAIFGLTGFERSVLALCAGVEIDADLAQRCADRGGPPTFGLALACLPGAHWSAAVPSAPLRRWRLVHLDGSGPLTARPLRIDERIIHALLGVGVIDADLDGVLHDGPLRSELLPVHETAANRLGDVLAAGRRDGGWATLQLCGRTAGIREAVAAAGTSAAELHLLVLDSGGIPTGPRATASFSRLCAREAALTGGALLVDHGDVPVGDPDQRSAIVRFAREYEGMLVIGGTDPLPGLAPGAPRIDIGATPLAERRGLWHAVLAEKAGSDSAQTLNGALDAIVGEFDLEPEAVRAAVVEVADSTTASLGSQLWDACRVRARPGLDDLSQRVDSNAGWDDLVLPEEQLNALREIVAQVRWRARVYEDWGFSSGGTRGNGVSVLFSGPSGTGKTIAAEVIACELRLDLYRVDLSAIVSKYIGDTEKNLRRLFVAAERGGIVLLFDEADALFGKRTEVKDSHDRFANIEVSYLLQLMETHRGLAILTTNQRKAVDEAFVRRLRYVVEFPFPGPEERAAIWQRLLPDAMPREGLDVQRLAQLAIAGGSIRNVALAAAFLAADAGRPVEMSHALAAARTEYAKLERPMTGAELEGWDA